MARKIRPSAVCLFCDDIREERSGTDTIVGIFPDNLTIHQIPAILPRLAVYGRIVVSSENPPERVRVRIEFPWDQPPIEHVILEGSRLASEAEGSRVKGSPILTVLVKAVLSPMPIQSAGRLLVFVFVDDEEFLGATLNVNVDPDARVESRPGDKVTIEKIETRISGAKRA